MEPSQLEIGQVYIGTVHKKKVVYKGLQVSEWYPHHEYHQFDYLILEERLAGYGQSDDQVLKENYSLCKVETVLYGTSR